ncbi:hypothetical protein IW262DRAFT_1300575 [Armillaria fumosa]|nr:hypothetical protein IW262DRAFT_1300575 [Armillaria fumosa]
MPRTSVTWLSACNDALGLLRHIFGTLRHPWIFGLAFRVVTDREAARSFSSKSCRVSPLTYSPKIRYLCLSAMMSALAAGVVDMHCWIIGMWHPNAVGDNNDHFTAQCVPSRTSTRGFNTVDDSVDVFQIAKARALSTNDDLSGRDLHLMDELYELRSHRARILIGEFPASENWSTCGVIEHVNTSWGDLSADKPRTDDEKVVANNELHVVVDSEWLRLQVWATMNTSNTLTTKVLHQPKCQPRHPLVGGEAINGHTVAPWAQAERDEGNIYFLSGEPHPESDRGFIEVDVIYICSDLRP